MEWGHCSFKMETTIKANLRMEKWKEKEHSSTKRETNMRGNSKMDSNMGKVKYNMRMESVHMKVIGSTTKLKEKES